MQFILRYFQEMFKFVKGYSFLKLICKFFYIRTFTGVIFKVLLL